MKFGVKLAMAAFLASASLQSYAAAETVLRLDEAPVGELDPAKASDYADSILMFNLYDTLVIPKQGQPGYEPFLAKSWESRDGKVFTFKLRDDVKFQSGNPLTAEDVVFSLERMLALGQGLSYLFDKVETFEATDTSTVKFTLKEIYAPFISALTRLPILDKKLVLDNLGSGDGTMKDWGQAYLSSHVAGTGAYTIISHNPQEETVMSKNPDYFLGVPAAAPDKVRLRYGLEAATVRTLIAQGEHEISSQWLPPEVLKSLAAGGAQLLTEKGTTGFYIKLNTTKAPFDDVNCRLAISNAFDYETGVKMVAITNDVALGSRSTGPIPIGMLGARTGEPLKQDIEKAKEYLSQCRYSPAEIDINISWIAEVPIEERFALLLQANLAQIGLRAKVTKVPWALFSDQVSKPENTPTVSEIFVNTMTGDPDSLLSNMYHSQAGGTWMSPEYLKDEQVDALLEKGRATLDEAERAKIYEELGTQLIAVAPSIFAQDQISVFAASEKVSVPALSDPSKAFALAAFGFNFRLMEMKQ